MVLEHYKTELELAQHISKLEAQVKGYKAICERLQAQADEMRGGRQWISVQDRLPEIDMAAPEYSRQVNVLAWRAGWKEPRQLCFASNGYAKTEKGRAPRWEEVEGRLALSEPTHWMPLPASPTTSGDSHD